MLRSSVEVSEYFYQIQVPLDGIFLSVWSVFVANILFKTHIIPLQPSSEIESQAHPSQTTPYAMFHAKSKLLEYFV